MSIYGALFAGVSGIDSQSTNLGIIANNIANSNTIGYKEAQVEFQTLVTGTSNTSTYAPGGVLGGNRQLVEQQGLLESTSSPTDVAIQGSGMFVVNSQSDSQGDELYTRAGSFTQDSLGNFVNAAGYFLQAWPLDRNGLLPGAPGNTTNTTSSANLASLETVNVQGLTGTAAATTSVSLGANLNAGQAIYLGAGADAIMDKNDTNNFGITSNELIVPTSVDSLTRGDQFNITTGSGLSYTYNYGGFTFSRDVTAPVGTAGGDANTTLNSDTPIALGANPVQSVGGGSNVVTITTTASLASYGLGTGSVVTLAGLTGVGTGITAGDLTGQFVITPTGANTFQIATAGTDTTGGGSNGGGAGGTIVVRPFAGDILDATSADQSFLGQTGTSGFSTSALSFTISTGTTTSTFTYTAAAPNAELGQFNNLDNLATAISDVSGLTARVVNNQLYVGATNADNTVTFANGDTVGSSGPPVLAGINWVNELGFAPISAGANRFNSLQSLAAQVNNSTGLTATVNNPLGNADVDLNVDDPLDTITFADGPAVGVDTNTGSVLSALGIAASQNSAFPTTQETDGPLGPSYQPLGSLTNMASGAVTPQFSRPVTIYDALGAPHNLNMAFLKTGQNTWAVEVYAQPATDVNSKLPNGMVAYGTVIFNGDGSLRSVSSTLAGTQTIDWTNGAAPSSLTFNWGTSGLPFGTPGATVVGETNGLSQFDSDYNVSFVNQNGAPVGQLTGVSVNSSGIITASYSNGETQNLYQIPLASFADPDQLSSLTGNVFAQSADSGPVNLKQPGTDGIGTIAASSLEQSNVELADQLTSMIVAQRAYEANTKVISTADTLLSDLDQIIQG